MSKPKFRKNPKTGRLEKLINGKYVPQTKSFWKGEGGAARFGRMVTGVPSDKQIKEAQEAGKRYKANNKKKSTTTNKKNQNRGALGILSPAVWTAMGRTKRNIAAVENPSGNKNSNVPSSRDFSKKGAKCKTLSFEKGMKANKDSKLAKSNIKKSTKSNIKKSTVFTKHYKTGKALGVMTRAQRRKYDAEAAGRNFGDLKDSKKNRGSGRKGSFGKGTYGKGLPSNPQLKTQTTKDKRDPNRHAIKIAPKDLPKDKVKMKDGSIVNRSSLYEKKKKKKVQLGTRLSKMFD